MKLPITRILAKYNAINIHGPFIARFELINNNAILLIYDVFESAYVTTKVNIKNTTIVPPYAPDKIVPIFNSGTNASAPINRIDGQSIAIVNHNNKVPAKIPNTCIPDADKPANAGRKRIPNINNKDMIIIMFLLLLLLFIELNSPL